MGPIRTIGIAGASCSGKTTIAQRLAERLPGTATILLLDNYYRDLSHLEPEARAQWNFDAPDAIEHELLEAQLAALVRGDTIACPEYDFSTHTRTTATHPVTAGDYLIVEGLFALYWPGVRASFAMKVFVDASDAVCLARRKARDVLERGRTEASVQAQYDATVRPMYARYCEPTRDHADVVLDGEGDTDAAVDLLLARLGD